jgi:hypothetical protein
VIGLVDSDLMGQRAAKILSEFLLQPNRATFKLASLTPRGRPPILESEPLWAGSLREQMEADLLTHGRAYYKAHAAVWLDDHATPGDCADGVRALEHLSRDGGFCCPDERLTPSVRYTGADSRLDAVDERRSRAEHAGVAPAPRGE